MGEPKICVIGRKSLELHIERIVAEFGLTADDVVLQSTVPGFDVWMEEVLPATTVGARLVCLPRGLRLSAAEFHALVTRSQVTVVNLSVAFWRLWVDWLTMTRTVLPEALRLVVIGSEAVPIADARRWVETFGDCPRLLSGYGLSESTITSLVFDVTGESLPGDVSIVPLGRPLRGTTFDLEPSSDTPGTFELILTGADCQLGYLDAAAGPHRRVLTAQGSVRTGDLVRIEDGVVHFVSRRDDLVKVRGVRISLAEVEAALLGAPKIRDAAVYRSEIAGGWILRALVVCDSELDVLSVRNHLSQTLPAAGVPAAITACQAIPRLPNGKIDRQRLHTISACSPGEVAVPPKSTHGSACEVVCRAMSEVLGQTVGPDDDFFQLGGHSLLAVALLNRLDNALDTTLAISDVFVGRTPRAIGSIAADVTRTVSTPPIETGSLPARIPLTSQQAVVWFHLQLEPGSKAYHCQSSLSLNGSVDAAQIEAALTAIVQRHAVYRTSFHSERGEPYQSVHETVDFALERVELPADGEPEELVDSASVQRLTADFVGRPFDISAPPLIRTLLISSGDLRHVLVIVEHHMVHDGFSFALFARELMDLYDGWHKQPRPMPDYPQYAMWQNEQLQAEYGARLWEFWNSRVKDVPNLKILTGRDLEDRSLRSDAIRVTLDQAVVDRARQAASRGAATLFQLSVAALALALVGLSGQRKFCIGIGAANRRVPGTDDMLGMFVNVLPVVLSVNDRETLAEYRSRCAGEIIDALDHQELPTSEIVRRLGGKRKLDDFPLFQVIIGFDDGPVPSVVLGGAVGRVHELTNGYPKLPLNITVVPQREQRIGSGTPGASNVDFIFEFDHTYLSRSQIEYLLTALTKALAALAVEGERAVDDLLQEISAGNPTAVTKEK